MNQIFIISIVAVLVLAGAGIAYYYFILSPTVDLQEISQPIATEQETADEISDWQTYRNEEYGFEIKLPPTWEDYKVSKSEGGFWPGVGATSLPCYVFLLPEKVSPTSIDYGHMFKICLFTHEEWERATLKDVFMAENKSFVFIKLFAQDYSDKLLQESYEIDDIISTFKFLH